MQVESDLKTGKWFYVLISWRQDKGLSMFIDGELKSQQASGADALQPRHTQGIPVNAVIGKNVAGKDIVFTKFDIASFATFNTFMNEKIAYDVYVYYWTNGEYPNAGQTRDQSAPQGSRYLST